MTLVGKCHDFLGAVEIVRGASEVARRRWGPRFARRTKQAVRVKKDGNRTDDKEILETCFAWIDGRSIKEARITLGDLKRRNKMIYASHVDRMHEWREDEEEDKDKKEEQGPECHKGCEACKYIRAV